MQLRDNPSINFWGLYGGWMSSVANAVTQPQNRPCRGYWAKSASGGVFAAMLRQQSTQKERRVVWQGQYAILKPNIPAMKLHAP